MASVAQGAPAQPTPQGMQRHAENSKTKKQSQQCGSICEDKVGQQVVEVCNDARDLGLLGMPHPKTSAASHGAGQLTSESATDR